MIKCVDQREFKLQKGDVVLLDASITADEFGIALMDERGELIRLDGVIREVKPHMCRVTLRRLCKPWKVLRPEGESYRRSQ